jgi:light-regulated signal transduction histidine kinase (bacteriophytochrome)
MQVLNQDIRKSGIKIIIDLDGGEYIKAVPAYLDSVILNLMSNAIKYKSPSRNPVLKISSKVEDDYRVLFFEDNGLGIDTVKNRDKLFGMYKTFHENEEAKGFGLFITKNQIEAMDGKIDLESKVDVGSTFKVYFNENN